MYSPCENGFSLEVDGVIFIVKKGENCPNPQDTEFMSELRFLADKATFDENLSMFGHAKKLKDLLWDIALDNVDMAIFLEKEQDMSSESYKNRAWNATLFASQLIGIKKKD